MRILLVEDEEKVSRFVSRGLTAERFAVDMARDGNSSWELAQTYQYDLIILDLMLPGLTGGEVLHRIRKSQSQVPVLILTARDSIGDKVEHFEAGANDYLTKPFAFAELLVRVKALLRRGPVTRASMLRIGDLELDRLSQQVKRAGKRVELTAKEYGVLEYLMANAGRVLSRTMILEHAWDQRFDGATNLVDVYVREEIALRETIFRIFAAAANNRRPTLKDLLALNHVAHLLGRCALVLPKNGRYAWTWKDGRNAGARLVWEIVRSAIELLISSDVKQVRQCAADDCDWLFVDNSRSGNRRWCEMNTCGNRQKAKEFYRRKKRLVDSN